MRTRDREGFVAFLRALAAEFLGTLIFIFFSTATVTSGCHTKDVAADSGTGNLALTNVVPGSCFLSSTSALLNIALAFGITLFVVIFFTAPFSGGHINPAVTFAFFLAQKISLLRATLYIILQCAGAAVASIILKGLDSEGYKAAAGAANQPNAAAGVSVGRALGFEIILTFVFVFTVFAATDSVQTTSTISMQVMAPLAIGLILFVCHLIAIPVDGCCVNPARGFGPAVVSRTFHQYWIFWVGPLVGATLACIIYQSIFRVRGHGVGLGARPHQGRQTPHKGHLPEDSAQGPPLDHHAHHHKDVDAGAPVNHFHSSHIIDGHHSDVEAGRPVTH